MNNFRSFRIHDNEGRIETGFESLTLDQLTDGEVVVGVEWSGINYKDALAATGKGRILRRPALNGGIDLAGHVIRCSDNRFKEGDAVIVCGAGLSETLDGGYVVTLADVRGALARQGLNEKDIRKGDAILFNFGWWRLWSDAARLASNWPGIGKEVAAWMLERKVSMVGSDAATDEATSFAVHHDLMLLHGVLNLEFMNFETLLADEVYEFLFVFTPLRLKGATGSPGRPLAIR